MRNDYIDIVYSLISGTRIPQPGDPEIENLFDEGGECEELYDHIYDANLRLCQRLGTEEDRDVEIMINSFLKINELVGKRMFHYGTEFASK